MSHLSLNDMHKKQEGIILVILPIIVLLLGLTIAYVSRSAQQPDFYKEMRTEKRMEEVLNALSSYVQRHNRLPCPARPDGAGGVPFGFEEGSGANGDAIPANCPGNRKEGIIPFNTLGLTSNYARDAWGKYITYAISPAFATNPIVQRYPAAPGGLAVNDRLPRAHSSVQMEVHAHCRSRGAAITNWIEPGKSTFRANNGAVYSIGGAQDVARNPWKARFCCAGLSPHNSNRDLRVNVDGIGLTATRDAAGNRYDRASTQGTNGGNRNIDVPVVVLVSHGINGYGAYRVNGSFAKFAAPAAGLGANERTNMDGTANSFSNNARTFYQGPRIYLNNGGAYFDDIVMYRTQNTLYAQTGKGSCETPY